MSHTINEISDAFNRCFTENYIGEDDCCETCPYLSEAPACVSRVIEDVQKLIFELEKHRHAAVIIGEICVEESKGHISADDALKKIREHIYYSSANVE